MKYFLFHLKRNVVYITMETSTSLPVASNDSAQDKAYSKWINEMNMLSCPIVLYTNQLDAERQVQAHNEEGEASFCNVFDSHS